MNNKIFAGIGSRECPAHILDLMIRIAYKLSLQGYTLRSGGATGCDAAFEKGCDQDVSRKQIYLAEDATEASMRLASMYHPAWLRCDAYARHLHGRNAMIILGKDLMTPVRFVICWTNNGKKKGGTATGIKIAEANNIPVKNLSNHIDYRDAQKFVDFDTTPAQ